MQRRHLLSMTAGLLAAGLSPITGNAVSRNPEHGSAEEAVAMVHRALELVQEVGLARAVEAFHDPADTRFHDRDLYVFAVNSAGDNVAHGSKPHIAGLNLLEVTDVNGKFYVKELIEVGLSGTPGWVDYWLDSPLTGTIVSKSSYVLKVDDEYVLGVGIYNY